mmetsp:Transcript_13659/g.37758  ORF Transcript_13659/g.37758 Transcript_13659/m.37758 type:complete len:551 (+) Transcript_13659:251-1903(+)|eukprot:CAMPEP_0168726340 /NCGR_PEP_ID=MMETSP0724-20121128/4617_1 /TAXON_ID=265536 /ORGANISM="Amphiprora sp., Strain CCMP467" /LENGTH=550 /DNA_ID=CAMNT_0008773149 /DNA_START=215 /DNA_END=1867 /DNA_ORIENTATION=+
MSENSYDPNVVIQAAQDKLNQNDDLEGGTMLFQHALLTWADDAREKLNNTGDQGDYETMQQAIVTLWIAYAEFLFSAHQYKSAMEAYEQAVNDPVAKTVGTVWLSYAQYAQERGKKRTAQQVYIRALVGNDGSPPVVQDEQESDILWQAFLGMMQESNQELTLADLQEAVRTEQQQKQDQKPPAVGSTPYDEGQQEPASKRMKLDLTSDANDVNMTPPPPAPELEKIHVVSQEAVKIEAEAFLSALQQKEVPPDILAAWMIRDGQSLPQPPEHPLFSPAPPKLSDPTAKKLLGDTKLALGLNQKLQSSSGTVVLKICQALWTLTALTEQHTSEAILQLDQSLKQVHEQREANFTMRIATATTNSVVVAIKSNIDQDRQAFQRACEEQREKLFQDIAWQLRRLLCLQQQVLTQLQVPGFSGPTVDESTLELQAKICSYLHSAFFLRNRIGPDPHLALLAAQAKRLQEQLEQERLAAPPLPPPPPPPAAAPAFGSSGMPPPMAYGAYNPQQQQQGGYGVPPPPPSYPPYVSQQQQQQQGGYGSGQYNYYPTS